MEIKISCIIDIDEVCVAQILEIALDRMYPLVVVFRYEDVQEDVYNDPTISDAEYAAKLLMKGKSVLFARGDAAEEALELGRLQMMPEYFAMGIENYIKAVGVDQVILVDDEKSKSILGFSLFSQMLESGARRGE